ncbi:MAG: HAD-IA family hydrolase [Deltaproteobacteria bacterium]|jgi:FMN phosphatase YigB (HAD superfamily)|nr:HAD-IA family hydrolase [Deltaproteobacteria bacterium]
MDRDMNDDTGNGQLRAFAAIARNLKVIALDCDGVLFDSREANVRFYSHIMTRIGRPPVRADQHEYIHMYPVRESLLYLTGGEGEDFDRAFEYFKTIDFGPFNDYLTREPGLVPFLKLASTHFRTALATNRTVSTMELLEQFNIREYFHLVVCASDVSHPKPHPEAMEKILAVFDVVPENVLYIGDSRVDEALAQATGVHFASYKNPSLEAELHIGHFQELDCLFDKRTAG